MDRTEDGFARRCLPLLIANQHGWHIVNEHHVRAVWGGGHAPGDVYVDSDGEDVAAHFGHGVLTWTIPYLFRTPPGWNLLARGPANAPKDAIAPLEGIVETDWSAATFTMNWKFTRPGSEVVFEPGDPICMIVPVRRGDLATFEPRIDSINADGRTATAYYRWRSSRWIFNTGLHRNVPASPRHRWQRHYFQGTTVDGERAAEHETRLALTDFRLVQTEDTRIDERSRHMTEPFEQEDLPLLNQLVASHPELAETAALVKRINTRAQYPINSLSDLTEALGGPDATVTFHGRTMTLGEVREFVPAYYFPISSERDLIAKLSDIQARPAPPARPPIQVREPVDIHWSTERAALPADAPRVPELTSQQVLEATRGEHGVSGLARRSG